MAFTKTLAEPNVGFATPVAPVQDNTTAQAVASLGDLASTGISIFQKREAAKASNAFAGERAALSQELGALSDRFVSGELTEFNRQMGKFGKMTDSQMRIRSEALLKKFTSRTNRTPEEVQALRQSAGQVLGFDPTGTAVKLEATRQDEVRKAEEARKKHFVSIGGDINSFGTPTSDRWYRAKTRTLQDKQDVVDALSFAEAKNDLASVNAPKALQVHTSGTYSQVISAVDVSVMNTFGKPLDQVTDSDIQAMDDEQRKLFVASLDEMAIDLENDARTAFSAYTSITDTNINESLRPVLDYIDLIKGRTDLSVTLDTLKNRNDLNKSLIENDLWNNKDTRAFHAFAKIYPQFPAPIGGAAQVFNILPTMFEGKITNDISGAAGSSEEAKGSRAQTTKWMKSFTQSVSAMPELTNEQKDATANFIKGFSRSSVATYDDMDQSQKDSLLEILQDPSMADTISKIPESAGEANALAEVASEYTHAILNAAAFDLTTKVTPSNIMTGITSGGFLPPKGTLELVRFGVGDNGVTVQPIGRSEAARKAAATMNEKYIKRLNKGITAQANLEGTTRTQVIELLRDRFIGIPGFASIFAEDSQ